MKSSITTAGLL